MKDRKDLATKSRSGSGPIGRLIRCAQCESGASLVEFALSAPALLMLLFGIIQFGAAMFVLSDMSNVARDASRRAATGEMTENQAETFAQNQLVNWGISYAVAVTVPDPDDDAARDVLTVITAPLADAIIVDYLGLLGGLTLTASAVMRQE